MIDLAALQADLEVAGTLDLRVAEHSPWAGGPLWAVSVTQNLGQAGKYAAQAYMGVPPALHRDLTNHLLAECLRRLAPWKRHDPNPMPRITPCPRLARLEGLLR